MFNNNKKEEIIATWHVGSENQSVEERRWRKFAIGQFKVEDDNYSPLEKAFGEFAEPAGLLKGILIQDIYMLDVLPFPLGVVTLKESFNYFENDLCEIITRYGNDDIIYYTGKKSLKAKKIGSNVFVSNFILSMPIKAYLIFHKVVKVPPEILAKCSGVPVEAQRKVYSCIISFFRAELRKEHNIKAQTGAPIEESKPASPGRTRIYYYGPYNTAEKTPVQVQNDPEETEE